MTAKTALIVGSTGMIGKLLTQRLLADDFYGEVKVLVRRPLTETHPKLTSLVVDFDKLDASLVQADHVFCTLGTTIKKAGSKEAFRQVDYAYPLAVGQAAKANGTTFYGIVTAMGADPSSLIFYNRVKGDVEAALQQLQFYSLGIFRPSMLLGDRTEARAGESIGQKVMVAADVLIPKKYKAIPGDDVAASMQATAKLSPPGVQIIESDVMYGQAKRQ